MVSIVIPNYNKERYIRRSLESVLSQTTSDWEAIVVDDCSADGSWSIIQEYVKRHPRIFAFRNEVNRGGCYSRNRGAKLAKGQYLIFLDSDDWLSNDCIERRVEELNRQENRALDVLIFEMATSRAGNIGCNWNQGDRSRVLISFLRHEIVWQTMMPIWRREAFERVGGFDESFSRLQDVELHTRALLHGMTYQFAERKTPDCFYFVDNARMTMNYEVMTVKFVDAMLLYVAKMSKLLRTQEERSALDESLMAAIRWVGDCYQSGRIGQNSRDKLYGDVLKTKRISMWVRIYAWLYQIRCNKMRGFNYFYRRIYRLVFMLRSGRILY